MNSPHDHLVKQAFADVALAAAFLRGVLPPALLDVVDLSSLKLAPTSLIDEHLQDRHLDLLFHVERRAGGRLLLHILLEHQSSPDPSMGWRIYRYFYHVWTHHERSHPGAREFPPAISLVLYHGTEPWPGACHLHDQLSLTGLPAEAVAYVPNLRYLLVDLRRTADARLAGTAFGRLVLLVLKYVADGDLWARLPGWIDLIAEVWRAPDGPTAMTAIAKYISRTMRTGPSAKVKHLIRTRLGDPAMEVFESWADKRYNEGEARGEARGRAIGEALGLLTGKRQTLLHLAQARFGQLPEVFRRSVESADSTTLDRWSLRLLTASSPEDITNDG